jgi:hypothetical protein
MEMLDKVKVKASICGIELDFDGQLTPDNSSAIQNFFNSQSNGNVWNNIYFGKTTVSFAENSKKSNAGISYNQTLSIKFPSKDTNRSNRLELFKFVKFIKIIFTDASEIIIGRNDYFQNTPPSVAINSTDKFSTVTFSVSSIFSAGYLTSNTGSSDWLDDLLPHDIPITFINI